MVEKSLHPRTHDKYREEEREELESGETVRGKPVFWALKVAVEWAVEIRLTKLSGGPLDVSQGINKIIMGLCRPEKKLVP